MVLLEERDQSAVASNADAEALQNLLQLSFIIVEASDSGTGTRERVLMQ